MSQLDAMEKDWLITSSGSDYHKMCVLLRDRADLAHRRDFINGVSNLWVNGENNFAINVPIT